MLSIFFVCFQRQRKETALCYIVKKRQLLEILSVSLANATHAHMRTHTRKKKTDYRYPGIKDTLLPRDILLLVLTLVNITCTCTTYVAVSVLICVSCQKAACLVKSGNRNINGDGVKVEVAVGFIRPSNQLFAQTFYNWLEWAAQRDTCNSLTTKVSNAKVQESSSLLHIKKDKSNLSLSKS